MDDSKSIWELLEARASTVPAVAEPRSPELCGHGTGLGRELLESAEALAAADGRPGPARRAGGPPARNAAVFTGSSDYLESVSKDCDGEKADGRRYEIAACGCRSWFCPHCCTGRGLSLRERLIPVLETFRDILMWTFTIDPKLFASPAAAYEYLKKKRCISNVMRRLRERGHMHSGRYICIVEWQKQTEMPHFHLLADASFIPFDVVRELWNRFRPKSAGLVEGDRPGFGSVRFSAPEFSSPRHAACYACKYLIKHPIHGYPDWVLDAAGEVHRYSTSRGFWGQTRRREPERSIDDDADEKHFGGTIRQRLAHCGRSCVLLEVSETVDEATGEVVTRRRFVCTIAMEVSAAASAVGFPLPQGKRRFEVPRRELWRITDLNYTARQYR